ncbi:MAG: hypothetical protein MR209_02490 [Veillonellaceae bacterium]|nr:hypothetical protein [Veillonellaceae bacterium]
MIEIKITGESAFDVVAEMQGLLCGAWLTDKDASQSAREAVAIDTEVKAAANGADVKSVPTPMGPEAVKAIGKAVEKTVEKAIEKASEPAATAEDVRTAFGVAMDRVGKDKVQALLEEYAPKLSQVKPEDYAALIERAEALV